jgi:Fur family transcriptional regulator, peroxide stress response regulator
MHDVRRRPRKKPAYRRSRQRERILELLRSTETHPTANWLYARLRREFPSLSLGTVYRNIGILIEQGLIGRIAYGSTFDRLDANVAPHYHFICETCGAIHDLDIPPGPVIRGQIKVPPGFSVRRHELELFGVCAKCAAKT